MLTVMGKYKFPKKYVKWIVLGILLVLSSVLLPVKLVPDSKSFISARKARAVLYPCFLHLFQFVFGDTMYLRMVVIIQNLLFIFAAALFIEFLCEKFAHTFISKVILYLLCACIFLVPSLMSKTNMLNIIWSESVSISCYLLFSRYLFAYILDSNDKNLVLLYIYALICALIRKQLLLLIPCVFLIHMIMNKNTKKKILFSLLLTVLSGGIFVIGNNLYNSFICSNLNKVDGYDCNTVANIIYFAQPEDVEDLDSDCQVLFQSIYEEMEKEDALYYKVKDDLSWYDLGKHKAKYYDIITFTMIWDNVLPQYFEYYGQKYDLNERGQMELPVKQNLKTLEKILFRKHIKEFIYVYVIWTTTGFLETIVPATQAYTALFPEHIQIFNMSISVSAIFILISVALYISYIILVIMTIKKGMKCGSIGAAILLLIIANAAAVSLFIIPLHRYLLYNSMTFYMFLFIMFREQVAQK